MSKKADGDIVDDRLSPEERARLRALLSDALVAQILAVLGADKARLVGGAVRNALLGEPVRDVDFATVWRPEEVMTKLRDAGFSMHPVGIDHGSVLAAKDGRAFEITTLRRDVRTDGRHAVVAYTDDWREDAMRRDFTMNALYLDAAGHLHDPTGLGLKDARARRLRFIGDARQRLREDYLRILRYFRFLAQYAADAPADEETLAVIAAEREGLARISTERVRAEMQRLLAAPGAARAVELMRRAGVDAIILPRDCAGDTQALVCMVAQDARLNLAADWLLRLVALCGIGESLKSALKLTRAEARRLAALRALLDEKPPLPGPEQALKARIYRHGAQAVRDAARLLAARGELDEAALRRVLTLTQHWQAPVFPLSGQDVLNLGVAPGRQVGDILRRAQERWIEAGFQPQSRKELLALLEQVARDTGALT